jgi:hypothetical protein
MGKARRCGVTRTKTKGVLITCKIAPTMAMAHLILLRSPSLVRPYNNYNGGEERGRADLVGAGRQADRVCGVVALILVLENAIYAICCHVLAPVYTRAGTVILSIWAPCCANRYCRCSGH